MTASSEEGMRSGPRILAVSVLALVLFLGGAVAQGGGMRQLQDYCVGPGSRELPESYDYVLYGGAPWAPVSPCKYVLLDGSVYEVPAPNGLFWLSGGLLLSSAVVLVGGIVLVNRGRTLAR